MINNNNNINNNEKEKEKEEEEEEEEEEKEDEEEEKKFLRAQGWTNQPKVVKSDKSRYPYYFFWGGGA